MKDFASLLRENKDLSWNDVGERERMKYKYGASATLF